MRAVREQAAAEVELSIVIPTHQRPHRLGTCIASLVAQESLSGGLELIVVVDGPDSATEQMLGSLTLPFPLRVIVQDHSGQAAARNRGAEEARGRYLLFLDDDVVVEKRLVAAHLDALRSSDHLVASGGSKVLPSGAPRWARSRQTVWRNHYDRLAAGRQPRFSDTYGGNLSLGRDDFLEVRGFATDLPVEHDVELGYRLTRAGMTLAYVPDAVAARGRPRLARSLRRRCPPSWGREREALSTAPGTLTAPSPRRRGRASEAMDRPPSARPVPPASAASPGRRCQARAE